MMGFLVKHTCKRKNKGQSLWDFINPEKRSLHIVQCRNCGFTEITFIK